MRKVVDELQPLRSHYPLGVSRWLLTLGRTARSWAGSGSGGMLPSRGRCTVVKQMLYSWMMLGYRLLKSSSSTMVVYRPFFGSSTRPPAYCALPFLAPAGRAIL